MKILKAVIACCLLAAAQQCCKNDHVSRTGRPAPPSFAPGKSEAARESREVAGRERRQSRGERNGVITGDARTDGRTGRKIARYRTVARQSAENRQPVELLVKPGPQLPGEN